MTPTLISQPDLDTPLYGTLTASWARGFRGPTGAPVPPAQWMCASTYPCITPVAFSLPGGDCGEALINPTGMTCVPGPCSMSVGHMLAVRVGAVAGCVCDLTPGAVKDWPTVATEVLSVNWAGELAAYLWDGGTAAGQVPLSSQTTFAAATPVAGGPYSVENAISVLTGQMRQAGYRGRLYFHAPDTLLPAIAELGAVLASGRWVLGNSVFVLDGGYPGTDPTGTVPGIGVGTGAVSMVVTGPGEWDTTTVETLTLNPHGDLCRETATLTQRWAAARVSCQPMFTAPVMEVM